MFWIRRKILSAGPIIFHKMFSWLERRPDLYNLNKEKEEGAVVVLFRNDINIFYGTASYAAGNYGLLGAV